MSKQRDLLLRLASGDQAAIWTAHSKTLYALFAHGLAKVTLTPTGEANAQAIKARQAAPEETQEMEVVR